MPAPVRLFTLAILGVALPASALPEIDGACSAQPMQWGCVGQLDVRSKESAVRMSGYRNKEILVELDSGGKRQRLLVRGALPSSTPAPPGTNSISGDMPSPFHWRRCSRPFPPARYRCPPLLSRTRSRSSSRSARTSLPGG